MASLSAFAIPVLLDTNQDAAHAVRQWARLYHYGHIYLPALCIATCGLYGYTAYSKRAANSPHWSRYALSAAVTISMVPFTWVFMAPTNNILFGLDESNSARDVVFVRGLLVKWAWLHVTRATAPLLGAYLAFRTLLSEF